MIYYVEVERGHDHWYIMDQSATREEAVRIARDYHDRDGENARVTVMDSPADPRTRSDR